MCRELIWDKEEGTFSRCKGLTIGRAIYKNNDGKKYNYNFCRKHEKKIHKRVRSMHSEGLIEFLKVEPVRERVLGQIWEE